ncbi:MAG: NAD(+)/NADH kinase [Acidobacteria bacterium]|nr:NAD(+)/NADH kinase [Acidobacteriota bacterium]
MTAPPAPPRRLGPIASVGITAKTHSPNAAEVVRDAVAWLDRRGVAGILESGTARAAGLDRAETCTAAELAAADLVLVIGGDGTLLGVAREVVRRAPATPILAVNCGSLGFLTEVTREELDAALDAAVSGRSGVDERQMLRARVLRGGSAAADRLVLNDVVVGRSSRSSIIELSISLGGQLITRSRADGVIVATPTGSTAYNLAAGGPIVHPTVDALVLTPIAPHTLTNRPIVLANTAPVRITPDLTGTHVEAHASFDGQFNVELVEGDVVVVERAPRPLRVVRAESRNYFAVLREKLKWGER